MGMNLTILGKISRLRFDGHIVKIGRGIIEVDGVSYKTKQFLEKTWKYRPRVPSQFDSDNLLSPMYWPGR
jgi:hypothetical protein